MTASNRREVFEFENYEEDDEEEGGYENEYFDDDKMQDDIGGGLMNVEVNMKKNKENGQRKVDTKPA